MGNIIGWKTKKVLSFIFKSPITKAVLVSYAVILVIGLCIIYIKYAVILAVFAILLTCILCLIWLIDI